MTLLGAALACCLLIVVLLAFWWIWRSPFLGLGVLVAGMGLHSFLVMALIGLGTPSVLIRAFQGWKELLIAALTVIAISSVWRKQQDRQLAKLAPADWIAVGLAVLCVVYFLLPSSVLHSGANLTQRAIGFRIVFLIPLMYFLGRVVRSADERHHLAVLWLCAGAGAMVGVLGLVELRFVPTTAWLDWGINQYTSFLGFTYHGPKGLPEYFFVTLPDGTLLRRMVSTYVSPLGIAYTGILLFPIGVALIEHYEAGSSWKVAAAAALALVTLGVYLSVTRLAVLAIIGEAILLFVLRRRTWLALVVPILVAGAVVIVYPYASIGPSVDRDLNPVTRSQWVWAISGNDTSANEHYSYLVKDIKVDLEHPLGLGTGAATVRYGQLVGTGESAVLGMFGDLGIVGGALYVGLYALALWNGFVAYRRVADRPLLAALPLTVFVGGLGLFPVTVTSDLWGDLSVTYLFWWAAGAAVTLALLEAPKNPLVLRSVGSPGVT